MQEKCIGIMFIQILFSPSGQQEASMYSFAFCSPRSKTTGEYSWQCGTAYPPRFFQSNWSRRNSSWNQRPTSNFHLETPEQQMYSVSNSSRSHCNAWQYQFWWAVRHPNFPNRQLTMRAVQWPPGWCTLSTRLQFFKWKRHPTFAQASFQTS